MIVLNKNNFIKFFLLFCITSSLFSDDITTQYRLNGIGEIEKQLDQNLMQEAYWENYLQDKNLSMGYIESYSNILICDKSLSTLTLYRQDNNSSYKIKKEYHAFTGKSKGDKQVEGDLRTPVGIYNLTKKISKLDSFYGPMAFVTSYPNLYDRYKGKDGSGIWIHGLPTEQERDAFTQGCIAIDNQNIKCLNKNIDISKTLLIINETKTTQNLSKEIFSKLLSQLYTWRYAWIYNDIDSYLNFYAYDFKRYDGMNKENFALYKTRIFNKQEKKRILFKNLNVVPYPNLKDTYQISFTEFYKSSSYSFRGDKILIAQLVDDKLQIITEQ